MTQSGLVGQVGGEKGRNVRWPRCQSIRIDRRPAGRVAGSSTIGKPVRKPKDRGERPKKNKKTTDRKDGARDCGKTQADVEIQTFR